MTVPSAALVDALNKEAIHVDFASHPAQRLVLATMLREAAQVAQDYADRQVKAALDAAHAGIVDLHRTEQDGWPYCTGIKHATAVLDHARGYA